MIAETSLVAYEKHKRPIGRSKLKVLAFIMENSLCSRKEIARALGMETASVSGRCAELLADTLIEECGTKRCLVSGNIVAALRVVPVQTELFNSP